MPDCILYIQEGGFYSAEDADSYPVAGDEQKKEGAFCVWTHKEVTTLLSQQEFGSCKNVAELFCAYYGIKENGNVDPHQVTHTELYHFEC